MRDERPTHPVTDGGCRTLTTTPHSCKAHIAVSQVARNRQCPLCAYRTGAGPIRCGGTVPDETPMPTRTIRGCAFTTSSLVVRTVTDGEEPIDRPGHRPHWTGPG